MVDHPREKIRLTVEDIQNMPERDDVHAELIEGVLIVYGEDEPMTKDTHQGVVIALLAFLLQTSLPNRGTLRTAPVRVYLDAAHYFEPDIFWVSADSTTCHLRADDYWHGAPDLVIEVLSKSTEQRDRDVKYRLYEQHGTREYWLVNPEAQFVEVYTRQNDTFHRLGVFGIGQTFASPILDHNAVDVQVFFGAPRLFTPSAES